MHIPTPPPDVAHIAASLPSDVMLAALRAGEDLSEYLPWDKIRYKEPPEGLTREQWWFGIKWTRRAMSRELPLRDVHGLPFTYAMPDQVLQGLDDVSRKAAGSLGSPDLVTNPATRDRYIINSLMEEATTSSILEGAATTRRVAKDMLRSGRAPRSTGERMIVNNYRAMQYVRDHLEDSITPERVLELHSIVVADTLSNPEDAGRVQDPTDERVGVWDIVDDVELHRPPPADQLPARLSELTAFARGETGQGWMHPLLRAIIVHFMVGYDHYFVDGNGRLARALFYWVALQNKLWLLEFVSLSTVLQAAPDQYGRAYLHVEQDEGDLTYFVVHQLDAIRKAVDNLHEYLGRKAEQLRDIGEHLRDLELNHRQIAIIEGMLRDETLSPTVRSHATSHRVTLPTARADLLALEDQGLLTSFQQGRTTVWRAAPNLEHKVRTTWK